MKIVVAALKGGVGKTTTSIYLAALAAAARKDVLVVDADPQGSAADWIESAEDPALERVALVEAPTERLLAKALAGATPEQVVVVDSPPGNERIIGHALEQADVVVIPTRVGGVEWPRVDVVRRMIPRRTPFGLAICSARTFTRDYAETVQYWADHRVEVWGTIPERVSVAAGPDRFLSEDGLDAYRPLWRTVLRRAD
ncbi:MAG: AAA family ATPase [Actinomycetota bacterium]